MRNVRKKFLFFMVFLFNCTYFSNVLCQSGWSAIPVTLSDALQDASEQKVAMDAVGNSISVWTRFDSSNYRVQASYYNQLTGSWSDPVNLSVVGQNAGKPEIAMDLAGNGIAVWQVQSGPTFIVQASRYVQATSSWSPAVDLANFTGFFGPFPQIAMDSTGNGIAVWQQNDGANYIAQTRRYVQTTDSWDPVTDLSAAGQDSEYSRVAMDPAGNGIATWRRWDGSNRITQTRRYIQATDSWDAVVDLSAAGQDAENPEVAMDSAGNGIAVWERNDGSDDIVQTRRYIQATNSWDSVKNLSATGSDAYDPQIAVDPAGNGIATWRRWDGFNDRVEVVRYFEASDSWGLVVLLSPVGVNAILQKVAMDSDSNGIIAWRQSDGSNFRIYASRSVIESSSWESPDVLSAPGKNANVPDIAMEPSGSAIAVWYRLDEVNNQRVQASHYTFPGPCPCPVVTYENISSLPTVYGEVGQFQIKGSRLGAEAHLMIDGGWVRELIHLSSCRSGDAPVSVIVLQNDGRVGLGSTHRNVDSLEASIVLGVNGVTLIANGNSRVDLNEDIIVNNVCHILTGPDFGGGSVQKLIIHSDEGHTIRVKSTGVLDLRSFTTENQLIEFSGDLKIVLEPGAKVMLGGSTMIVTDNVRIECDTLSDNQVPHGTGSTDSVRVKFVGTGRVQFKGNSKFVINKGSFVGIESFEDCNIVDTSLRFELNEYAKIFLGEDVEGGAFQVGNTTDITDANITFSLLIYGYDAGFIINSQGFLGLNVGVTGKDEEQPNLWYVRTLHNVDLISIDVNNGIFVHDRIFTGTDPRASLVALGLSQEMTPTFYFEYSPVDSPSITNISKSTIRGGGNFILLKEFGRSIHPVVLDDAGEITDYLSVGLLASKPLLGTADLFGFGNAKDLFNYWKTTGMLTNAEVSTLSNAASGLRNKIRLGYIDRIKIGRDSTYSIVGDGGIFSKQEHTLEIGAVQILVSVAGDAPRAVLQAFELN